MIKAEQSSASTFTLPQIPIDGLTAEFICSEKGAYVGGYKTPSGYVVIPVVHRPALTTLREMAEQGDRQGYRGALAEIIHRNSNNCITGRSTDATIEMMEPDLFSLTVDPSQCQSFQVIRGKTMIDNRSLGRIRSPWDAETVQVFWRHARESYLVSELKNLESEPEVDEDGYRLKPTDRALAVATRLNSLLLGKEFRKFPLPIFSVDGEGGIRIEWQVDRRHVRLAFQAEADGRDYLYHELGDDFGGITEPSASVIRKWLEWLIAK